jgi:hypothetical protein
MPVVNFQVIFKRVFMYLLHLYILYIRYLLWAHAVLGIQDIILFNPWNNSMW